MDFFGLNQDSKWVNSFTFFVQEEIYRLEKGIESDQKLKHMAELQLSVVSDPASKHQIQVAAQLQNQLTAHARLLSFSCPLSLITTQNIRSE